MRAWNCSVSRMGARRDVLLTDVGLPGMPGGELAARAVRQQPQLRIIFASGYNAVAQMEDEPLLARAIMLRKPYDDDDVEAAMRAAMEQGD